MFEKLKTALKHSEKLTLIIKGDDSSLTIAIFADPKENGAKVQPITIKGTYEEVSAEFDQAIAMVFEKNDTLLTNAKIVAEGVKKAADAKTTTTAKKKEVAKTANPAKMAKPNDLFAAKGEPEADDPEVEEVDDNEPEEVAPEPVKPAPKKEEPKKPTPPPPPAKEETEEQPELF